MVAPSTGAAQTTARPALGSSRRHCLRSINDRQPETGFRTQNKATAPRGRQKRVPRVRRHPPPKKKRPQRTNAGNEHIPRQTQSPRTTRRASTARPSGRSSRSVHHALGARADTPAQPQARHKQRAPPSLPVQTARQRHASGRESASRPSTAARTSGAAKKTRSGAPGSGQFGLNGHKSPLHYPVDIQPSFRALASPLPVSTSTAAASPAFAPKRRSSTLSPTMAQRPSSRPRAAFSSPTCRHPACGTNTTASGACGQKRSSSRTGSERRKQLPETLLARVPARFREISAPDAGLIAYHHRFHSPQAQSSRASPVPGMSSTPARIPKIMLVHNERSVAIKKHCPTHSIRSFPPIFQHPCFPSASELPHPSPSPSFLPPPPNSNAPGGIRACAP